jgi:transposase
MLKPILFFNYHELRRQRPRLMLMLDGAAAHVSRNCLSFYEGWEVNHLN